MYIIIREHIYKIIAITPIDKLQCNFLSFEQDTTLTRHLGQVSEAVES